MRKLSRWLILWFLLGAAYFLLEIIWRVPGGQWPHWSMWMVGGLCGVAVGGINQVPAFYGMKIWKQSLIGTATTLAVELLAGCLLNLWLGLEIWDYTGLPGNLWGQICLPFGLVWFLLMPFAIWLEDHLRWRLWREGEAYSLPSIYFELVTGK